MTSERTYTVSLQSGDVKVTNEDLSKFRDAYGLSAELATRTSELLWLDLYIYSTHFELDPHSVLLEIKHLESGIFCPTSPMSRIRSALASTMVLPAVCRPKASFIAPQMLGA